MTPQAGGNPLRGFRLLTDFGTSPLRREPKYLDLPQESQIARMPPNAHLPSMKVVRKSGPMGTSLWFMEYSRRSRNWAKYLQAD